nr:collagenase 3-like [Pseudochaenichthys georgianus]
MPRQESSPSAEPQVDLKLATEYLEHYYNLQEEPMGRTKRSRPFFTSKVKDMQIFFGLNATGVLNSDTLEIMRSPRCGVPDVEEYSHLQGTRWNKNILTYRIGRYTRDLHRNTVDSLVESAFSVWASASSLTFVRSHTRNADIMVEFVTYEHGDLYPFDGPRGTLAHAFGPGPGVGGDTHFDDAEYWTAGETGMNLLVVAAHEFGHALGLKHSRNPDSLMYPTYRASRSANLLSIEDVVNINALYSPVRGNPNDFSRLGRSSQNNPWLSGSLLPQLMQNKCASDTTFDAVSTVGDATFFFRDRYLWIKHNEHDDIKEGLITNFMPKIETSIDAAFWVPRRSAAYLIHDMDLFWMWIPVLGSLIFAEILWSLPIDRDQWPRPQDVELAEGYLRRFYSLNPRGRVSRRRIRSTYAMEEKIIEMQHFFGLRETGGLNPHTLNVMKKPRCGVPDVENFSFYPRKPTWKNHTITYMISTYTPDMKREDVEKSFRSALKLWSDAAPLKFIKVNHGKADIVFSFACKTHGDFFPFDGPRGVLAHAFQPGEGIGGDVHFDEDETWTARRQGYSLFAVAAHELGHLLGLTHSKDPSAIMYPNYRIQSSTQYSLSKDDELGIQALYGKPKGKVATEPAPEKCGPHFSYDAAVMIGKEIVFFKDRTTQKTYWSRLTESHSSTYLPSISSHVDAAYDIPAKGVAYIFTGHKYWVVRQLKMKSHARSIHEYGFSSRVKQVDAAVHVSEYGKTVFFIGEFYYRYDELKRRMDPGFPRLIQKDWPGIPKRVDAAFKLEGKL